MLTSCSAHWLALHPPPNPVAWHEINGDANRLRLGLRELYAWYRETEPMTANILRDAEVMPALQHIITNGLGRYLNGVREILIERPKLRGRKRARVNAAARVAVDFHTWRSLADLGDDEQRRSPDGSKLRRADECSRWYEFAWIPVDNPDMQPLLSSRPVTKRRSSRLRRTGRNGVMTTPAAERRARRAPRNCRSTGCPSPA